MVFKVILRKLRKSYVKEFAEVTGHKQIKDKGKRDYLSALNKYVTHLLNTFKRTEFLSPNQLDKLRIGLIFVMGSLFYPKDL